MTVCRIPPGTRSLLVHKQSSHSQELLAGDIMSDGEGSHLGQLYAWELSVL